MRELLLFILILTAAPLSADIGERELADYKAIFIRKIISDNSGKEPEIRRCLDSMIKDGSSGVRIIDKLGLFMYDSMRGGLKLEKVRFYREGASSLFMITLKDAGDNGGTYNLFLEYTYTASSGGYRLTDISFSRVFTDRIESVTRFFSGS